MENTFTLRWDHDPRSQGGGIVTEEVICDMETVNAQIEHAENLNPETIIPDVDSEQMAAENLIFLAQDVGDGEVVEMECQVTEEVITDDWVQPGGQERVEVPLDQLVVVSTEQCNEENNIDVPLPTDQDEYTAMRPYPCDFCSRRFRKKANLVNHMTAHQNDRPYGCNLCGARYVRRCDLLHHLKVHAYVPDEDEERDNEYDLLKVKAVVKRKARRRSRLSSENGGLSFSSSYSLDAETSVAARTQQYGGQGQLVNNNNTINNSVTPPAGSSSRHAQFSAPALAPEIPVVVNNRFSVTDPRRPFVCQHCGVGFAREKALASHARIHGGDSPLECSVCGELCWSREQLIVHYRNKHPHRPLPSISTSAQNSLDYSEVMSDASLPDVNDIGSPELTCRDCGAGFQRADLLRRHVKAAHSYKLEPMDPLVDNDTSVMDEVEGEGEGEDNGMWEELEHTCGACGEGFRDALDLLAHAESHARSRNNRCMQCGEKFSDEQSMADHVETAHGPISSYTCTRCGRVCRDKRALLKHTQTQHATPQLTQQLFCSKCGKSFHNKARLKRHMTSHRDKAVSCNICGESFTDGRSLMNHRHSHSASAARQFPCRECGKTFGSRSSQQIHIRIHTGERPYACRFCWKAFADGGTLRKHERIHTGEKPYACAVCPRAFNQRVVLREHVRSHHSAPDTRRGTGAAPFWCAVCGRLLHTSGDLVQHLIQHSDANTALKRQPQTGPRKYKRRRKLKPHEVELFSNRLEKNNESEVSLPEPEEEEPEPVVPKRRASQASRRGRKRKVSTSTPPKENSYTALLENISSPKKVEPTVSGSARTKGKGRVKKEPAQQTRPKMIHTQKVKGTQESSATPTRGRRRCTVASTTTATVTSGTTEERRPRTKNVRYHEPGRPPAATFPAIKMEPDTDIAADLREILRAPSSQIILGTITTRRERSKRGEVAPQPIIETPPAEVSEPSPSNGVNQVINIKLETVEEGPFKCEMCSLDFTQRGDLLSHVRIHI